MGGTCGRAKEIDLTGTHNRTHTHKQLNGEESRLDQHSRTHKQLNRCAQARLHLADVRSKPYNIVQETRSSEFIDREYGQTHTHAHAHAHLLAASHST